MSYVSVGALGAAGSVQLAEWDAAASAAIPSTLKSTVYSFPLPTEVKSKLINEPISLALAPMSYARAKMIQTLNLAAGYAGLTKGGKTTWDFYGVSLPAKFQDSTDDLDMVAALFAMSHMNPFAVAKAVAVVFWKTSSKVAGSAATTLMKPFGLAGLGAAGAGTAAGTAAGSGGTGAIILALIKLATAMAPVWVPMLKQAIETGISVVTGGSARKPKQTRAPKAPGYLPGGGTPEGGSSAGQSPGGSAAQQQEKDALPGWLLPAGLGLGIFFAVRKKG